MKYNLAARCAVTFAGALAILSIMGCHVVEDIKAVTANKGETISASSDVQLTSSTVSTVKENLDPMTLGVTLYPATRGQQTAVLDVVRTNQKAIFDYQVKYISENEVISTNRVLPTGHTLYADKKGEFIFSGGSAVYVKLPEDKLEANLDNPNNPLYDISRMHDYLELDGRQLRDENGAAITFADTSSYTEVTGGTVSYNNLIINNSAAYELLDSTDLYVPLSIYEIAGLKAAKKAYAKAERTMLVGNSRYAAIVDNDVLRLYFDGEDKFVIDLYQINAPRKINEAGLPDDIDFYDVAQLASAMYAEPLAEIGVAPTFEPAEFSPDSKLTVYDAVSGKLEDISLIHLADDGALSLSLEALKALYGVQLFLDDQTRTLHLITDPMGYSLVTEAIGGSPTGAGMRLVSEKTFDPVFAEQQSDRLEDDSYIYENDAEQAEPGVPKPIIRTPKGGQFTYPGSSTKIWKSPYRGKGEPASLRPSEDYGWQWNSATGFWEGISPLSGMMVVWHPSYNAAFTIR